MKHSRTIAAVLAVGVALAAGTTAWNASQRGRTLPPLPDAPSRVPVTLLEAHPFTLVEPATHWMRAERPTYTEGWLLVLETSRDLLVRRQSYENVLYVGSETAERVNTGAQSGRVVAIVPGPLDLAQAPIFFGEPELPENVTKGEARRQLQLAWDAGVRPYAEVQLVAARRPAVVVADPLELHVFASFLIEQHAADEVDLISGLRVKRLR